VKAPKLEHSKVEENNNGAKPVKSEKGDLRTKRKTKAKKSKRKL
jgi:hypothetical protein